MAKKKPPQAPAYNMAVLSQVVQATLQNSFVYVAEADLNPLVQAGMVEFNPDQTSWQNGNRPTIATQAGKDAVAKMSQVAANPIVGSAATTANVSAFTLETGFEVPAIKRGFGAKKEATYPFDAMGVGQSFFVPATVEKDDPAKSLASTVSSATRRYETPVIENGQPKMEVAKRAQRDAAGNIVKGADGKMVKVDTQVPVMNRTREFVIRSRTVADERKGQETAADVAKRLNVGVPVAADTTVIGARIWRVK